MATPAVALLQKIGLFSDLSAQELDTLSRSLRVRRFARGEVVCHRDDPGNALYVIEEGFVKIGLTSPDGREVILTLMGPGDFFGELALLDGEARSADVTAVEPTGVLMLQRDFFLQFLEAHPGASPRLLAALTRQIRRLTNQVYDSTFFDLQTRLARALLKLPNAGKDNTRTVRMTQTQLGAVVGATRESVNKWLGFFEDRRLIQREKGGVVIVDPRGLEAYASTEAYISW
jgi:CRP-like cAMP-binding protein